MPSKLPRLFVKSSLRRGAKIDLATAQAHYLTNVLRRKPGDSVLLFNGVDGEWRCDIQTQTRNAIALTVIEQTRAQESAPDLHYLFSPLKRARLDYMAQKATEMGANLLQPVIMRRTIAEHVKGERLLANAIEASEQCGILSVPDVGEPKPLPALLADWDPQRHLIFADEQGGHGGPVAALGGLQAAEPLAVLIGPEGGFDPEERALLLDKPFVLPISLGPRIMRADTAAVAALALVNAVLSDWR